MSHALFFHVHFSLRSHICAGRLVFVSDHFEGLVEDSCIRFSRSKVKESTCFSYLFAYTACTWLRLEGTGKKIIFKIEWESIRHRFINRREHSVKRLKDLLSQRVAL